MRWITLLLFLTAQCAFAETLRGKVIRIADGDTLTVLDAAKGQHRVRLAGIDAPERKQPFYQASRQNLARLTFGKLVAVDWHKQDRYGRLVGKVLVDGRDTGLAQVRAGFAWWFKQYAHEQSAADRARYGAAELGARASGRGLWRDGPATPPWESRRASGHELEMPSPRY